jgi:D-tyrosyl-tRNA(Tyr) deacylase
MIGLLQRVNDARVEVAGVTIGAIGNGLLVFVGVERGDNESIADRLLNRLLGYRVFVDSGGKMNRNLRDVEGELLLVPQFTLAADTTQGLRASFTPAAPAEEGQRLFEYLFHRAEAELGTVASGVFGADMQVKLTNSGPVTFWLQVPPGGTREVASTGMGSHPD